MPQYEHWASGLMGLPMAAAAAAALEAADSGGERGSADPGESTSSSSTMGAGAIVGRLDSGGSSCGLDGQSTCQHSECRAVAKPD